MVDPAPQPVARERSRQSKPVPQRLLALEIRSKRIGFALFEGETEILDWGTTWLLVERDALAATVRRRLRTLLELHKPRTVVARNRNCYLPAANRRFTTILNALRTETRRCRVSFRLVSVRNVQRYFEMRGAETKYAIAQSLADRFPELSWNLPAQRKAYESEPLPLVIFDAAATGVTFLESAQP